MIDEKIDWSLSNEQLNRDGKSFGCDIVLSSKGEEDYP